MDHRSPILYVNAVSFRGLLAAAELADRLGRAPDADEWRRAAAGIRQSWQAALQTRQAENERTYICGIWPAGIVRADNRSYLAGLQRRWEALRDSAGGFRRRPLWTYFAVAEAHQWLLAGRVDRVWQTLRWFWQNQASDGLYTWWEGDGEENTFGHWEQIRGWLSPPHVTPHYWTAAEMLLLQLDMLACVDRGADGPVLRIGQGVPKKWLQHPMSVRKLSTRLGRVDWSWRDGRMRVTVHGQQCAVRLGPAFPADTPVEVNFVN